MYKKCKIIMIQSEQINKVNDICLFDYGLNIAGKADLGYPTQHLYILSDNGVKEGEWIYYLNGSYQQIVQCEKSTPKATLQSFCKKIVATTDSSLKIKNENFDSVPSIDNLMYHNLPSIPQSFIDKYVSEYNKGNKIEEVMVEYINNFNDVERLSDFEEPKLNVPDNTINIKSIKDNWTREELCSIMQSYHEHCLWDKYITPMDWLENNL